MKGTEMKIIYQAAVAAGLLALAACNNTPAEQAADNIEENGEAAAENITDTAENVAENITDAAENKADAVEDAAENKADSARANDQLIHLSGHIGGRSCQCRARAPFHIHPVRCRLGDVRSPLPPERFGGPPQGRLDTP